MILLNGLLTYGRIFKILLHHTNVIGSIRLPNSSPVMLPIVGKSTPPIVYKLLLMEEIRLNSWYGESTTIYAGFYTSEVVIARFLVYQDNKPNRGRMFLFVSSPAGVSSSERRVRFQFVFKFEGPSRKLTWPLKIHGGKMNFLLGRSMSLVGILTIGGPIKALFLRGGRLGGLVDLPCL